MNDLIVLSIKANDGTKLPLQKIYKDFDDLNVLVTCSKAQDIASLNIHKNSTSFDMITDFTNSSKYFLDKLNELIKLSNLKNFIIDKYQEYLYPFLKNETINKNALIKWSLENMDNSHGICILTPFSKTKMIFIQKNKIGLKLEYKTNEYKPAIKEEFLYFSNYQSQINQNSIQSSIALLSSLNEKDINLENITQIKNNILELENTAKLNESNKLFKKYFMNTKNKLLKNFLIKNSIESISFENRTFNNDCLNVLVLKNNTSSFAFELYSSPYGYTLALKNYTYFFKDEKDFIKEFGDENIHHQLKEVFDFFKIDLLKIISKKELFITL